MRAKLIYRSDFDGWFVYKMMKELAIRWIAGVIVWSLFGLLFFELRIVFTMFQAIFLWLVDIRYLHYEACREWVRH